MRERGLIALDATLSLPLAAAVLTWLPDTPWSLALDPVANDGVADEALRRLVNSTVYLAALRLGLSVLLGFLGRHVDNNTSRVRGGVLRSFVAAVITAGVLGPCLHTSLVVLGAPLSLRWLQTAVLAQFVAWLALYPAAVECGISPSAWQRLVVPWWASEKPVYASALDALQASSLSWQIYAAVGGVWLGAPLVALDWQRPWLVKYSWVVSADMRHFTNFFAVIPTNLQYWPLPAVYACAALHALSLASSLVRLFRLDNGQLAKKTP